MVPSKLTRQTGVALMVSVVAVQLALEGYGMLTDSGTAEFGAHLAFASLWVVFGGVTLLERGKTRLSVLTAAVLVASGMLEGYSLLASTPILGDGVAEILAGVGALLYAAGMRRTRLKPFQRA